VVIDVRDSAGGPASPWAARLSAPGSPICTPDWLGLREPADHAARAVDLAVELDAHLGLRGGNGREIVVRDLGCGSGSMGRWLAPRLHATQHWFVHDRDADLALQAALTVPAPATPVVGDLDAIEPASAPADLVVCSALLDLLRAPDVARLARIITTAGAPALLTLTVTGEVAIDPPDPLDAEIAAAFDAHQRRDSRLGPDAADVTADALTVLGRTVRRRPSPWHLGPSDGALVEEWLRGRLDAACEHEPSLRPHAGPYLERRLDAVAGGALRAEVGHTDLLALPDGAAA
jgi:hypothetical protein